MQSLAVGKRFRDGMEKPGRVICSNKRGQVMVEYVIVLLSVVLMYFMLRWLWYAFNASSGRVLDIITWKYP